MKEPVDHIERPRLPWRGKSEAAVTECGYDASKVKTLTREEFFKRLKEYGQQRTAMVTCMTCTQTANSWPTWDTDPRKALEREITWECRRRSGKHDHRLKDELFAIEKLIEQHPEDFKTLLQRQHWLEQLENAKARDC